MKLKVLDLFSGVGGFSLGLERAGMETVAFVEWDANCQRVLKKHWPQVPIMGDITKVRYIGGKLIFMPQGVSSAQTVETNIDLLCGGFPCQDISVAGKQKGFKDELGQVTRSGLWKEFKRLIGEVKPRYVLIENVANLRSKGLGQVIQDLWEIGYVGEWHLLSARSIGAPHLRERIWIIAHANSSELRHQHGGGAVEGWAK